MVYFRSRYQCLFNLLTFCVLLGCAAVCGCSEPQDRNALAPAETTTQPITREMVAEVLADVEKNVLAMESAPQFVDAAPMAPMQRPPTMAEMTAQLRQEFPGNILDDDFTKMQEIIASEIYLQFLKRTYQEYQFQNFDEFWALASADEEPYVELLNTYFKPPHAAPTTDDVSALHYMTLVARHVNVRLYHGEDKKWDMFFEMMSTDPVKSWLEQRFFTGDDADLILMIEILVHHAIWVEYLQEEDQESIQAFFLEHGMQKGVLRVALEEPVRLGYILKDFTDVEVFKRWVDGKFSKNAGQQKKQHPGNARVLGGLL